MWLLWVAAVVIIVLIAIRVWLGNLRKHRDEPVIAFFHPNCADFGGGERVLWAGVLGLEQMPVDRETRFIIYCREGISRQETLAGVQNKFGMRLHNLEAIEFVYLKSTPWLEAGSWRRFTLLGQSLGSMWVAWEALRVCVPDLVIDTTGAAFTYPIFRFLGGCRVATYTHYPTVSTDMLRLVWQRRPAHNNPSHVAQSRLLSAVKLIYYLGFALCYGLCGRSAHVIMVNSNWTRGHIDALWRAPRKTRTVFPPCDTARMQEMPLEDRDARMIVSVGQFRCVFREEEKKKKRVRSPEKDHALQVKAVARLVQMTASEHGNFQDVRLVLVGSARNEDDRERVRALQAMVRELDIENNVEFRVNAPYSELLELLGEAIIGLHTMWNEHFGICVVEYMAAGCIPLAHNSGGPQLDIVRPHRGTRTGWLATTEEEYAKAMADILSDPVQWGSVQRAARARAALFSEEKFCADWCQALERVVPKSRVRPMSRRKHE